MLHCVRSTFLLIISGVFLSQALGDVAGKVDRLAKQVEEQLIAPCCWRQPLSQHYSGTAEQMKVDILKKLSEGQSTQDVIDHYTGMYGDRILSSPPNDGFNRMAYLITPLMFITGFGIIFLSLNRWRSRKDRSGGLAVVGNSTRNSRHENRINNELKTYD